MPTHTWKKRELQVAKWFGTVRNPLSGGNGKHSRSDSLHDFLFLEHKHAVRHAITNLWDKCKSLAQKEKKIPVVTLSVKGRPGFWVLVKESDLVAVANQREIARKNGASEM